MWQDRFLLQVGNEVLERIHDKKILVVGLGGVGGYVLETLTRSGFQNFIIVDYDLIDITNLNRQIISDTTNIGTLKVDAWEQRMKKINPLVKVVAINKRLDSDVSFLFNEEIDYIVDTCDTLKVKLALIEEGLNRHIKTISCMGTGNKLDPTKLKITNIWDTSYDPLAKKIRKYLRDKNINSKVMVISSSEKPLNISSKIISSNAFVPATAGLLITSYIVNDIINNN